MYISIGNYFLFDCDLWSEKTGTWGSYASSTWIEFENVIQNGKIKLEPRPTIHHVIEDRSTAEFTIIDYLNEYHFEKGQEVIIRSSDDLSIIFGGYIDSVSEKSVSSVGVILHDVTCTDYHYLADKRIVAKAWKDTTVDAAVNWILDNILYSEGITEGSIVATKELVQYIADYISATEALDKLAEIEGNTWWISEDKKLYFVPRGTYTADWDLEENSNYVIVDAIKDSLVITNGNPEYRNKQYLKGSKAKTSTQTEYFTGDGIQQTFTVGYPIFEEPEVWLKVGDAAYVQKSVGIKGVETDHDFYWSKDDNTITQELGDDPISKTTTDILKVIYIGLYNIVAVSTDFNEVLDRKAVEGDDSSGYVEMCLSDSTALSLESALEKVNALLTHYASIGKKIEYQTTRSGLSAGTLQHIKLTKHSVDNDCLIGSIDIEADAEVDYYTVNAYTGPIEDSWTNIFLKLNKLSSSVDTGQGTSDVLLNLQTFTHYWTSDELPNIWMEVNAGSCLPSNLAFPCFDEDDRIKYMSFYYGGEEKYRIFRTSQIIEDDYIISTFIVPSQDANFVVDQVKLIGGDNATLTFGTGTIVETHTFAYTKNSLESLQMQFTSYNFDYATWLSKATQNWIDFATMSWHEFSDVI